jgi:hypothetical protein
VPAVLDDYLALLYNLGANVSVLRRNGGKAQGGGEWVIIQA